MNCAPYERISPDHRDAALMSYAHSRGTTLVNHVTKIEMESAQLRLLLRECVKFAPVSLATKISALLDGGN